METSSDISPIPCFAQADKQGVASGIQGNYCAAFPQSAYYTKPFQNIWQLRITPDGRGKRAAYCMQKGKTGPLNGRRYRSVDAEQGLPGTTAAQRLQAAWLLQNVYPSLSASEQFAQAGVDEASTPPLDENDAYAAAQVAIWSVFNPPDPSGWTFYACGTETPHPKSERLQRLVTSLYQRSLEAVEEWTQFLACEESGCRVASMPGIACVEVCGDQAMTQGPNGWLFGPLRVRSRLPFTLSLETCCAEDAPPLPFRLVDETHAAISAPASGQRFYIAFPQGVRANCYHLSLRTVSSGECAVMMQDVQEPQRFQVLGTTTESDALEEETSVCFCCYAPVVCPVCPEPPPCPVCPEPPPCPVCPEPPPCPDCPEPPPCPVCPEPPPCPVCPGPPPCPVCPEPPPCPVCPEPPPCPVCPEPPPCPACPELPLCPEPPDCPKPPSCPSYPQPSNCSAPPSDPKPPTCNRCALRQCRYRFHCLYPGDEERKPFRRYHKRPACSVSECANCVFRTRKSYC